MTTDKRDPLAVLKSELGYLEAGGYSLEKEHPWRAPLVFEDSPTCLNHNERNRIHPCTECALYSFVPADRRAEQIPCRHIPLTEDGQTVNDFYRSGTQRELEWNLMVWLRKTIRRLEGQHGLVGTSKRACTGNCTGSCRKDNSSHEDA